MKRVFRQYLLAGIVFQSVMVGGGYATGRELIEFFLSAGPATGLAGIAVATLIFSTVLALAFEFARRHECHDYRQFFRRMLGRGWILFEAAYLLLLVLVLSVIAAAAGEIVSQSFGVPRHVGVVALIVIIAALLFLGSRWLETLFAGWSFVLYATFATFLVTVLSRYGENLSLGGGGPLEVRGALSGGLRYAGYSLAVLPAILFCVRHLESRRQALVSGLVAGPLAMIPATLLFLALACFYPDIAGSAVPTFDVIGRLDIPVLTLVFQVVILGTFIETGAGLIHGFNERVVDMLVESGREAPAWLRPGIGATVMLASVFAASTVGLVDLIAKGYGSSTYVFLALVAVPVLFHGARMLIHDLR